jgi:general secretion pathway protein G
MTATPLALNRRRARALRRGFTLTEMLVVLAIIGLIAALVGPRVLNQLSSSREKTARLQIEAFKSALDLYYIDMGRYPTEAEGLEALIRKPQGASAWSGPYLRSPDVPADPWGHPYKYRVRGGTFEIVSLGPEGREAGAAAPPP